MGTRYFESTDDTFAATLLKKYRRYFSRYIFEKVPTVLVLDTVIRYFSKKKICSFWKQYFWWFYALNNDWVSYLPSGNWYNMLSEWIHGNNYLKKKNSNYYTHCITPKPVTSLLGLSPRQCIWATQLLLKKSHDGGKSLAPLCSIWSHNLRHQSRAHYHIGYLAGGILA